jgi:tRNA(Arg) A34 adenosine deaminase TadA
MVNALPKELIESVAADLTSSLSSSQMDIAFLLDRDTVYFAKDIFHSPKPTSSIVNLIQGIYSRFPRDARRIIRNRIFTTQSAPSEMCLGMVKVAAKRLTSGIHPLRHSHFPKLTQIDVTPSREIQPEAPNPLQFWDQASLPSSHSDFLQIAVRMAASIPRHASLHQSDRPVAALLAVPDPTSGKLRIEESAINSNSANKTLHAEVNLIQKFHQKTGRILPAHSRIYTSLKCCKMCAGMIWHCAEDLQKIQVYYHQDDPGPKAKTTVFTPGSLEQKRALHSSQLRMKEWILEYQIASLEPQAT